MFDRLVGMETEYAVRFHPADSASGVPSRHQLYLSLVQALRLRLPVARARHFKEGVFTAAGGAVWFETERPALGAGLVEGATPECRGARRLVAYQRAQDRLLAEAAAASRLDGEFRLLKNDRDAEGNVYGAQENYEAQAAHGVCLWIWRVGLALLLPLVVLTRLAILLLVVGAIFYFLAAGVAYLLAAPLCGDRRRLSAALFGIGWAVGDELGGPTPIWLETVILWGARLVTAPLATSLVGLTRMVLFRSVRRRLLPFLVSRPVFAGAGNIDERGNWRIADKAPAINCVVGLGGFISDRPIFTFGHFFKAACIDGGHSLAQYLKLFSPRQRLQIGLGDSNMCQVAEYLRVGATLLVLDCIEAGAMPAPPRLRRPIRALRTICSDPKLEAAVTSWSGRRWTAIELQRFYLRACRSWLEKQPDAPAEALDVLRRWEETIDALESCPRSLVGSVDWITKQFLLEQCSGGEDERLSAEASADFSPALAAVAATGPQALAKKKIDLKYHELSSDGYFAQLQATGAVASVVTEEEIQRAMRSPPPDSPATMRGRYIREFAGEGSAVSANWDVVVIGSGRQRKRIPLAQFRRRTGDEKPPVD